MTHEPKTPDPSAYEAELMRLQSEAVKYLASPNLKAEPYGVQVWGECLKGGDSHVFDVRGWGELTGRGSHAQGLSEEDGIAAQRARQAYLVAAWNAVPALLAENARLRECVRKDQGALKNLTTWMGVMEEIHGEFKGGPAESLSEARDRLADREGGC